MATFINLSKYLLIACFLLNTITAYTPKNVIYWGQESDGSEQALRNYCTSTYDVIVMGFVYNFPTSKTSAYPGLNFAGHCSTALNKTNPNLLICPAIAADITYCQSQGVQILLSFGGAQGTYGFTSDSQASTFATMVWNMFLGGSSTIRPFGSAVLDGIDLDIEKGTTVGYAAFITQLRSYFTGTSKTYYISSAPQCLFPDAFIGPGAGTAMQTAWFDYIWVQFYNNNCKLGGTKFNFNTWANWASQSSVNPNVKIFIGAPAGPKAADSGYVTALALSVIVAAARAAYPTVFGGVMLWDTSNSDNNNNFGAAVAEFFHTIVPSTTGNPSTPVTTRPSSSSTAASISPSTTASISSSTTASIRSSTTVSSTTGSNLATRSTDLTCISGHSKCLTSETYTTCDNGAWGASHSCDYGLTCSASGNSISCA